MQVFKNFFVALFDRMHSIIIKNIYLELYADLGGVIHLGLGG